MPRLIAFLRAINVGGHNVTMAELRGLFSGLGLKGVETFIASGNVIFTAPSGGIQALERKAEDRLRAALGYEVGVFIRTEAEVAAIARYKAFEESQLLAARAFSVGFLAAPLGAAARKALMGLKTEIDDLRAHDREVYWLCRNKQSESRFSNATLERALKVRATFRGMSTVSRLAAKYAFAPAATQRGHPSLSAPRPGESRPGSVVSTDVCGRGAGRSRRIG